MRQLSIAVAQFEPKDGDKEYNLTVIEELTRKAKESGADIISFHEMSITAYTHCKNLTRTELETLAENVQGKSTDKLISISEQYDIPVLAGLVEIDEGKIYNTYICVDKSGVIARYRKIHPFISQYMSAGSEYIVFNLKNWKCGILICYDNNVIENVRATSLMGAEIIFAPHVTMCTPSPMPGRGYVADEFWQNRYSNPDQLRKEFDGPKGREWLMRWLPARAYDNGVFYVFTNPIGYDGEHLKNGNSMIIDPYGEVLTEIKSFENTIQLATVTEDKLTLAGGYRYKKARKPALYKDILGEENQSVTKPTWMENN